MVVEVESWQRLRAFQASSVQCVGIESESFQNGRSHLHGFDGAGDSLAIEARMRDEQHHIGVVAGESAMFRQLSRTSGVGHADVGCHDNVRGPGITIGRDSGLVEVGRKSPNSAKCGP